MEFLRSLYQTGVERGLASPFRSLTFSAQLVIGSEQARVELFPSPRSIRVPHEVSRGSDVNACTGYDNTFYLTGYAADRNASFSPRVLVAMVTNHQYVERFGNDRQKAVMASFTEPYRAIVDSIVNWGQGVKKHQGKPWKKLLNSVLKTSKGCTPEVEVLDADCEAAIRQVLEPRALRLLDALLAKEELFPGSWPLIKDNKIGWLVITIEGDSDPLVSQPSFVKGSEQEWANEGEPTHSCLITGDACVPVRLHTKVSYVPGMDPVPYLSYNFLPYCYEGHVQGFNYPISKHAHDNYIAAVRFLTEKPERDGFRYRNVVAVCKHTAAWIFSPFAEHDAAIERLMTALVGTPGPDETHAVWHAWQHILTQEEPDFDVCVAIVRGSQGRACATHFQRIPYKVIQKRLACFARGFRLDWGRQRFPLMMWLRRALPQQKGDPPYAESSDVVSAFLTVLLTDLEDSVQAPVTSSGAYQYLRDRWLGEIAKDPRSALTSITAMWLLVLTPQSVIPNLLVTTMDTKSVKQLLGTQFTALKGASTEPAALDIIHKSVEQDPDRWEVLQWWRSLKEPHIDDYVRVEGDGSRTMAEKVGYQMGRLVALDCTLRMLRDVNIQEQALIRTAMTRPKDYIRQGIRTDNALSLQKYARKYRSFRWYLNMREDVLLSLSRMLDEVSEVSSAYTVHFSQGFQLQWAYCQDYLRHRRNEYADKNPEQGTGPENNEGPEGPEDNGDSEAA